VIFDRPTSAKYRLLAKKYPTKPYSLKALLPNKAYSSVDIFSHQQSRFQLKVSVSGPKISSEIVEKRNL